MEFDILDVTEVPPELKMKVRNSLDFMMGKIDPLDLIEGFAEKNIVEFLRKNGIDGFVVRDILLEDYGFSIFNNMEIRYPQDQKETDKKITYALKHIHALQKNKLLTKTEIKNLEKTEMRLKKKYYKHNFDIIRQISFNPDKIVNEVIMGRSDISSSDSFRIKSNKGTARLLLHDVQNPKTLKQLAGIQMNALFEYIEKFFKSKHNQKETFALICELYKRTKGIEFSSTDEIKKLIENNREIYNKIKSSKKIGAFKNHITSNHS
jgi:hypothetical protein